MLAEEPPQILPVPGQGGRCVRCATPRCAAAGVIALIMASISCAPRGTPCCRLRAGIVARIGENSLGGTVVWVLGPGGDRHYYAHLNSIADIKMGQRVAPSDVLGTVGTTGNARGTPPHLHYGVYRRAQGAINPFPLLMDRPAGRANAGARKQSSTADRSAE